MPKVWIKNTAELAVSETRKKALQIVSAGLDAINTPEVIRSAVKMDGNFLSIRDEKIDLKKIRRIIVVGFGKAAAAAAYELEKIMGDRIFGGAVIDLTAFGLKRIRGFKGTHPKPSQANVDATEKIVELAEGISASDFVIVISSGGGSSLLCWPKEEFEQSAKLYDEFLHTGGNIEELNTIRKHVSQIKGGGLAKLFYPAKIIGLIFCDIPGGKCNKVASGPTFKDSSTIADAEKILKKYGLNGFYLNETPKEDLYFKNVLNVPLVTNETALNAMAEKG
ncbi:MAG: glycerate-2-kinase family protein, partial [Patescibacteria group bacterium]